MRHSKITRQPVLRSVVLFWLFLAVPSAPLRAMEPEARHYEIGEQASDCKVYRAVYRRFQEAWEKDRQIEAQVKALLVETRTSVETCAREKGIGQSGEVTEFDAAQVCGEAYSRWLAPGIRLQTLKEDAAERESSMRNLGSILRGRCNGLNPPQSVQREMPSATF